jgi:hypothetical protein
LIGGTLYKVKKTSVYLDPELDAALARRAAGEGITKAELIRRTLEQAVRGSKRPRIRAIGIGDGPGDVADEPDRHLAETRFGDE